MTTSSSLRWAGGLVSVTCPACGFSASAPAEAVGAEWAAFMETIEEAPPEHRGALVAGGVLGYLVSAALFAAGLFLSGAVER